MRYIRGEAKQENKTIYMALLAMRESNTIQVIITLTATPNARRWVIESPYTIPADVDAAPRQATNATLARPTTADAVALVVSSSSSVPLGEEGEEEEEEEEECRNRAVARAAQTAFADAIRIIGKRRGSAPRGVPRSLVLLLGGSPSSSSAGRTASAVVMSLLVASVCSRQEYIY